MRIDYAHLQAPSTAGVVDFAVFNANAVDRTDGGRALLLDRLTVMARQTGKKIDASGLIFEEHGQVRTYGDHFVVDYLSHMGIPAWTHWIDA